MDIYDVHVCTFPSRIIIHFVTCKFITAKSCCQFIFEGNDKVHLCFHIISVQKR